MAKEREVSFTVRIKDAGTAALKDIEQAAAKTVEKLFSFKDILGGIVATAGAFSLAEIVKDITELGIAADKTFRQIAANLPTFTEGIGELRENLDKLAETTGRNLEEVRNVAAEISKYGVKSAEDLALQTRAAIRLSDATGVSASVTAQVLQELRREFDLTGEAAEEVAAKLATAARGRANIEELLGALGRAAPIFQNLGADADTGTKAIIALVEAGHTARAIGTDLKGIDLQGLRDLAATVKDTGDALEDYQKRVEHVEEGTAQTLERWKTAWKEALESAWDSVKTNSVGILTGLQALKDHMDGLIPLAKWQSILNAPGAAAPSWIQALTHTPAPTEDPNDVVSGGDLGSANDDSKEAKRVGAILAASKARQAAAKEADALGKQLDALAVKEDSAGLASVRFASQIQTWEKEMLASGKTTADLGPRLAEYSRALAEMQTHEATATAKAKELAQVQADDLVHSVEAAYAALTGHGAEAAAMAIDARAEKLKREIRLNQELGQATKDRLIHDVAASQAIEKVQNAAAQVIADSKATIGSIGAPGHTANDDMTQLMTRQQQLLEQKRQIVAVGGDEHAVNLELLDIDKAREELLKRLLGIHINTITAAQLETQHTTMMANALQQAVDGALQLGNAFGLIGHATSDILRSVGQMAAQIPVLMKAIDNFKSGAKDDKGNPLATFGTVVGAALPVAGAVATLTTAIIGLGNASAQAKQQTIDYAQAFDKWWKSLTAPLTLAQTGNSLDARKADLHSTFDDARAKIEKDFAGKQLQSDRENFLTKLNDLEAQRTALLTEQYNAEQKQLQEDYNVRLLRAEGFTTEANAEALAEAQQRELTKARDDGASADTLAALQAAQYAETQKAAADVARQAAQAQEDLHVRLLRATGNTDAADSEAFRESQQREYDKAVADGADVATLAALKQTQLAEATKFAADQAEKAAQAMYQAAEASFNQADDVYGTGGADQATERAASYGFDLSSYDLKTKQGVDGAIAYLQGLYAGADQTTKDEIQSVIHALRSIQITGDAGSGASSGSAGGSQSAAALGFQSLTYQQGDRLGDIQLQQLNVLKDIRDDGRARWGSGSIARPSIGSIYPGGGGIASAGASVGGGLTIGSVNVRVVSSSDNAREVGTQIADAFNDEIRRINANLGRQMLVQKTYEGDISARPR